MARKRMISPEIWESQSFGELSILAKVLFIGMISQADDDGKGVLSAQLLKSRVLPYDELRIADIDKALREIGHKPSVNTDGDKAREEAGHKLSVTYYEVGGKQYYYFNNWRKWQTINRPIPSKLPNPPVADGEGGGIHSHEEITDNSVSTHAQFSEYSRAIEDIKEKNINTSTSVRVRMRGYDDEFQERFHAFCNKWDIAIDSCSPLIADLNFDLLDKAYSESVTYLQDKEGHPQAQSLDWIVRNYQAIIGGKKYKDKAKKPQTAEVEEKPIKGEVVIK